MRTQINFHFVGMMLTLALGVSSLAQQQPPDAATLQVIESCATSSNMPTRDSGTRPSNEQRLAFEACLTEQNVTLPRPPRHHKQGSQSNQNCQPSSSSQQQNTSEGSLDIE